MSQFHIQQLAQFRQRLHVDSSQNMRWDIQYKNCQGHGEYYHIYHLQIKKLKLKQTRAVASFAHWNISLGACRTQPNFGVIDKLCAWLVRPPLIPKTLPKKSDKWQRAKRLVAPQSLSSSLSLSSLSSLSSTNIPMYFWFECSMLFASIVWITSSVLSFASTFSSDSSLLCELLSAWQKRLINDLFSH